MVRKKKESYKLENIIYNKPNIPRSLVSSTGFLKIKILSSTSEIFFPWGPEDVKESLSLFQR